MNPKRGMERVEERWPGKASLRRGHVGKDLKEEREEPSNIRSEEGQSIPGRENSQCKGPEVGAGEEC